MSGISRSTGGRMQRRHIRKSGAAPDRIIPGGIHMVPGIIHLDQVPGMIHLIAGYHHSVNSHLSQQQLVGQSIALADRQFFNQRIVRIISGIAQIIGAMQHQIIVQGQSLLLLRHACGNAGGNDLLNLLIQCIHLRLLCRGQVTRSDAYNDTAAAIIAVGISSGDIEQLRVIVHHADIQIANHRCSNIVVQKVDDALTVLQSLQNRCPCALHISLRCKEMRCLHLNRRDRLSLRMR